MDSQPRAWYFSSMSQASPIPVFTLYGETDQFPDVIHCEGFSARAPIHDWRIKAHRHAHLVQLFLIFDGSLDATIDNRSLRLERNEFLYVPASCVHEFQFVPGTAGRVISVPTALINSIGPAADEMTDALSVPLCGTIDGALKTLTKALEQATRSRGPFRIHRAVGLAQTVLALIAEGRISSAEDAERKPHQRLQKLDALIVENMSEGWGASHYADALAITTGHLSRLCRDATGMGAMAYIEHRIMQEACRLLSFTQLPVSDVGYRLGYADPSYFSKRFLKSQQRSPTAYRRQFVS